MGDSYFKHQVQLLIDELKSLCNTYGLSGTGYEYKIISEVFTYKLLNDKLLKELGYDSKSSSLSVDEFLSKIPDEEYDANLEFLDPSMARFKKEHFIGHLYQEQNEQNFDKTLDRTLQEISNLNKSVFSIETSGGERTGLFEPISHYVTDTNKRSGFCKAIINKIAKFSFYEMFNQPFDFYASIFEYLISDYNKDSGRYAEYYTPSFCANIIAELLVQDEVKSVNIYDPASGSGTLLMALAHKIGVEKCSLYSQDISQKSSDFLRLNLILNNLVHSLHNVIQGDTLLEPYHKKNKSLRKFDYVVSNPPFKTDFSDIRDKIASDEYKRFFAGVPAIPKKKKDGMPIYLLFLQHILASLDKEGKACFVVPSGFCTDTGQIPSSIRAYLVDNNYLKGVIQMPSNIFANTNTSVSLVFIDKKKGNEDVIFIDASSLGEKVKVRDIQKTNLTAEETRRIIETFLNKVDIKEFSKRVKIDEVLAFDCLIKPGLYFGLDFQRLIEFETKPEVEIDKLKMRLQGIYRELKEKVSRDLFIKWFVEYNFLNKGDKGYKDNNGAMKNSEIGEIPENWNVFSLNDLVCEQLGGSWGKDHPEKSTVHKIRCIRGADIPQIIKGEYDDVPTRYISEKHLESKRVRPGDLIIEISGGSPTQSTGRICIITEDTIRDLGEDVLCTNFCRILRFKNSKISRIIYTYLELLYDRSYFFNLENNTTGIKNLLINVFLDNIKIALPKDDRVIDKYFKEVNKLTEEYKINEL